MTVALNAPVSDIEGIGPVTAQRLLQHDVRFALDLVRVRPAALHGVVSSLASLAECKAWTQAAHLLQVAEVTPQWAEALVDGGITTVEMLARADLTSLEALFAQAVQANLVPVAPLPAQIAEMVRDATAIYYTGSVTGTVVDGDGKGVDGAKIEVGLATAHANASGRYRVLRVPLGGSPVLVISHDGFDTLVVDDPPVVRDDDVLVTHAHTLTRRPDDPAGAAPSSAASPVAELDELLGDVLPPASAGLESRVERQAGDDPRPGDVLMVHKLYESAPDALLQSRFRSLREGKIVIRTYRVALSSLPSGIKVKDHVERLSTGLAAVDMTAPRLGRRKALRRIRSRHTYAPATLQERAAHVTQIAAEMAAEPEFGPARLRRTPAGGGA